MADLDKNASLENPGIGDSNHQSETWTKTKIGYEIQAFRKKCREFLVQHGTMTKDVEDCLQPIKESYQNVPDLAKRWDYIIDNIRIMHNLIENQVRGFFFYEFQDAIEKCKRENFKGAIDELRRIWICLRDFTGTEHYFQVEHIGSELQKLGEELKDCSEVNFIDLIPLVSHCVWNINHFVENQIHTVLDRALDSLYEVN